MSEVPIVVDEDGRLMNFLSGQEKKKNADRHFRPYAYFCFTCKNTIVLDAPVKICCEVCGDKRFVRIVRGNQVVWAR